MQTDPIFYHPTHKQNCLDALNFMAARLSALAFSCELHDMPCDHIREREREVAETIRTVEKIDS